MYGCFAWGAAAACPAESIYLWDLLLSACAHWAERQLNDFSRTPASIWALSIKVNACAVSENRTNCMSRL